MSRAIGHVMVLAGCLALPPAAARAGAVIVCDGARDVTRDIQQALDDDHLVRLPDGRCLVAGTLVVKSGDRLIGAGRTASGDGGPIPGGTEIWATGGGAAVVATPRGVANTGLLFRDLTIATSSESHYEWVLSLSGLSSSRLEDMLAQNNGPQALGAVTFVNENEAGTVRAGIAPVWINSVRSAVFGTRHGRPLDDQLTDSRFSDLYLSGGSGSIEQGANNVFSTFMIDNASGIALLVAPFGHDRSLLVLQGGSFQNCGVACLEIDGATPTAPPSGVVLSALSFNNTRSARADLILNNLNSPTLSGIRPCGRNP